MFKYTIDKRIQRHVAQARLAIENVIIWNLKPKFSIAIRPFT